MRSIIQCATSSLERRLQPTRRQIRRSRQQSVQDIFHQPNDDTPSTALTMRNLPPVDTALVELLERHASTHLAFVVSDARQEDCPIVYASEEFYILTGASPRAATRLARRGGGLRGGGLRKGRSQAPRDADLPFLGACDAAQPRGRAAVQCGRRGAASWGRIWTQGCARSPRHAPPQASPRRRCSAATAASCKGPTPSAIRRDALLRSRAWSALGRWVRPNRCVGSRRRPHHPPAGCAVELAHAGT